MNTTSDSVPSGIYGRTLASLIHEALRDDIIAGRLKPGERVNDVELTRRFRVSRIPLREALRRLEGDGLVWYADRHGVFVTDVSAAGLKENYLIRECLESLAIRLGCEQIGPEGITALNDLLVSMQSCVDSGDLRRLLVLNKAFHLTIYRASGFPGLCKLIESFWDQGLRYRFLFIMDEDHARVTMEEHRNLVVACERRDLAMAEGILRQALAYTKGVLSESSYWDETASGGAPGRTASVPSRSSSIYAST